MPRLTRFARVEVIHGQDESHAVEDGVLQVRRWDDGALWLAFLCPCGCGAPAVLPNIRADSQGYGWGITLADDNTVTVAPSVLFNGGCRSHFFIRHNRVEWC